MTSDTNHPSPWVVLRIRRSLLVAAIESVDNGFDGYETDDENLKRLSIRLGWHTIDNDPGGPEVRWFVEVYLDEDGGDPALLESVPAVSSRLSSQKGGVDPRDRLRNSEPYSALRAAVLVSPSAAIFLDLRFEVVDLSSLFRELTPVFRVDTKEAT